ncbi:cadherin-23 isoform X2 [Diachasmimorpha longicaudata]|uniref:cadherin-23 isoform X2 n=1 Tax=Diachasmimorpha longicaudata TaxID=58733 RepID=UPI0030B8AF0D
MRWYDTSSLFEQSRKVRHREDLGFICVFACLMSLSSARNHPPQFLINGQTEIVVRLKEGPETPVGTLIYRLRGIDVDGDALTFGVKDQPGADVIRVENFGSQEANVFLNRLLDREVRDEYALVLTLTDDKLGEGNFITQSLLLLVEDINDNVPIFRPHPTTLTVREDSGQGVLTTVEANDLDEGPHGQVVYHLQELDGDNDLFSISTVNGKGVIRLVGELDYEKKYLYQLRILAVDRAISGKVNTGTTTIIVKVQDVEDQPPEFIAMTPVARISENANIGTSVLHVRAIDGDKGINNRVSYSITEGPRHLFDIDSTSGVVFTRGQLDREAEDNNDGTFILEITVKEISKVLPTPSVTTEVTIILIDVNDETPRFRSDRYLAEVNENAPQNTPVNFIGGSIPEVYDHDLGSNGTFRMYIEGDGGVFEITPFRGINEAPFLIRVKNSKKLDFEQISVINFTLIAKEIASFEPKFTVVPITVLIKDQNDNYPEFVHNIYEVNIPENSPVGTTVAWVQALDADSGNYGSKGIRYTNLGGSIAYALKLNTTSGVITIKNTGPGFDRELVSRHYLTVEARDDLGRGNRNTVQLIVNIEDVNDNPPIFLQNKYEAVLLENKNNFESPLRIEAFDIDLNGTKNSQIIYSIVASEFSKNLTIDPKEGIIKPASAMDYENLPINQGHKETSIRALKLTVRARDMGIPSLSSDAPLTIYLKDTNDNEPMFERSLYQKNIPEDLEGGTTVLQVKAWDKDLSAPNNKIVYRIQNGAGDKFIINPESGIIQIAPGSNLDPDLTSPKTVNYLLNVVGIDSGTENQKSAEVLVNITIIDVNNKPPIFKDPGTVFIKENTEIGAYIHRIVAHDPDISPILRYRIDSNASEARNEEGTLIRLQEYDYLAALELNAIDGLLRVKRLMDREKVETIKLGLIVEDLAAVKGVQTASAILNIIIEDENDNNPRFRRPFYRRTLTENSKNGVHIASVVADDADKNRTITYSLESDSQIADLVHLDFETGEMVAANKIDREIFAWLNMTVRATDSGIPPRSSLSEVYVQILDENDNNPYFITDITNITVLENTKISTEIMRIEARDPDAGDNGKITYLLDRLSSQGKFAIHPITGVLTVVDVLDWEVKSSYVLIIEAWDNYQFGYTTGESRNAFKQIEILVEDVNDNTPIIDVPEECVMISEFHDPKDVVALIKAKDSDNPESPNGRVTFRISAGNEMAFFMLEQIDHWTARIKSVGSLRGKFGNYSLNLEARDLGNPVNVDEKILHICVSDYNDNPPVFLSPQHNTTIRVPENVTVGSSIIQVEAVDADIGLNGDVHYRLKQDVAGHWRTFHIDDTTGVITLKHPLDRETKKMYQIRVEAHDFGTPTPLSTDLDLIIYVTNINDYEPQFVVDAFRVTFTEEEFPGAESVILPETIDKDEVDDLDDPPTQVCYFIVGGNDDEYFRLDMITHKLTTGKTLDREQQQEYLLMIKATEDCNTLPMNQSFASQADNTLLKVNITVSDVNDNPPKFLNRVFTGGVTTAADFGTQFMHLKALDLDEGDNAVLNYYQEGKIHMTLTEGLDDMSLQPFLIDKLTGAVILNFDPQPRMKGYFDFMVIVNDTDGLQDTARVFIYLLREDQRVRFVLRQHPPEVRNRIDAFREILGNVTGAIVNVDEYKIHENHDGSVDRTRTDLYLHLVNRQDNSIFDVSQVLELVDRNIEKLDDLFKEFNVLDTQPAQSSQIVQYEQTATTLWLLALTIFLGALLMLCIALCLSQRASFQRQLKAANASPFSGTDSEFIRGPERVPNTNKHSVEGSNPIWMHAYENEWFKNDESFSHTSDRDSLDENALNNEETTNEERSGQKSNDNSYSATRQHRPSSISSVETVTDNQAVFSRESAAYQQQNPILNNPLGKKVETTEL